MEERHESEQYFFDAGTIVHLSQFLQTYDNPCCLCAPTVGQELERSGFGVRTLDMDERFSGLKSFLKYDLKSPHYLAETFGIVLVDPPFFNAVPTSQFLDAIRMLSHYNNDQKILVSWPNRRSKVLLESFSTFNLKPTGYRPSYVTVVNDGKNAIEFFGNLGDVEHCRLASGR
jgi:Probable N6-adenine methyltransferase